MIEFSGVRSSCDMLARNWDLRRLASMSRELEVASPSYRRAFSSEMAAWVASSRSTSSSWSSKISPESFSPRSRMPFSLFSTLSGTIRAALIASSSPSAVSKYLAMRGLSLASSLTSRPSVLLSHCTIGLSDRIESGPALSSSVVSSR